MSRIDPDPAREQRITLEIVVDAYTPEEVALGWYYYLEKTLQFPFAAIWLKNRHTSGVAGESVTVVRMADEDDCDREMFVEVAYDGDEFSVPLNSIAAPAAGNQTQQAIEDWHYWCDRGFEWAN